MKRQLKRLTYICIGILAFIVLTWNLFQYISVVQARTPQQATPSTVTFNTFNTNVSEGVGDVEIQVRYTPGTTPTVPVTVSYKTLDGTAVAPQDYNGVSGQLVFTPAVQAVLTFTVTINDDPDDEPEEKLNLVLQSVDNAELGAISDATITIQDNDAPPDDDEIIYTDDKEPNDSFNEATDIVPNAADTCELTLWPTGDVDYFRFSGKAGSTYEIFTSALDDGVDTFMRVYNPSLQQIGSNDDQDSLGSRASSVTIVANENGFYFVEITNLSALDPTGQEYCIVVDEIPPLTPTPSNTPVPGADDCEFNSTFETACTVGVGEEVSLSFVPTLGSEQDTDILKLWVLPGVTYTCETFDLAAVTDTNIILYNQNREPFNPWIGNADRAIGDPSSEIQFTSTYKGFVYVMIGPENVPPYEESDLHTYSARCTATVATATPTPQPTLPPSSGGGVPAPSPTPFQFPTAVPTPTPIDLSILTPMPPTRPVVGIEPLPTATAPAGSAQSVTINVTLYYDGNENFTPELTEGIMDAAIALYDNATGQLIAFGYTNEAGMAQFTNVSAAGAVRVSVPFLNYSQVIVGAASDILIRVAPQPLPIGIP